MSRETSDSKISYLRLLGLALLVWLFTTIDFQAIRRLLLNGQVCFLLWAIGLNIPLVVLKALRWQRLLRAADIQYPTIPSILAYMSSIFIGLLTPGRVGEMVRAVQVSRECQVPVGRTLGSVLVDRVCDMSALVLAAGLGGISLPGWQASSLAGIIASGCIISIPFAVLRHDRAFAIMKMRGEQLGRVGRWVFSEHGWVTEMRASINQLGFTTMVFALLLTAAAYGIFFSQCYLLALALRLDANFLQVSAAAALGNLAALLPISFAGLGTREVTIIAYLGMLSVPPEVALSFSLLMFVTFSTTGGLMGAVAWWVKPPVLSQMRFRRKG